MNCYVCAWRGEAQPAVALCPQCLVGLCPRHVAETRQPGPGGLQLGCRHGLLTPAAQPGKGLAGSGARRARR